MSESQALDAHSSAQPSAGAADAWPPLPTETEIYLLPTGEVVVADLPAELAELIAQLTADPVAAAQLPQVVSPLVHDA